MRSRLEGIAILMAVVALTFVPIGCGDSSSVAPTDEGDLPDPGEPIDDDLGVTARFVDPNADYVLIAVALGDRLGYPIGQWVPAVGGSATATFRNIPEGLVALDMNAYRYVSVTGTGFPNYAYFQTDYAIESSVSVTSGETNSVTMTAASYGSSSFLSEHIIVDANYTFDASHSHAGCLNRANITRVLIDNFGSAGDTVLLEDRGDYWNSTTAFGVFLTDPTQSTPWPAVATWVSTQSTTLDANGDAVFWIVVEPGAVPFTNIFQATNQTTSAYEYLTLRIAGHGELTTTS